MQSQRFDQDLPPAIEFLEDGLIQHGYTIRKRYKLNETRITATKAGVKFYIVGLSWTNSRASRVARIAGQPGVYSSKDPSNYRITIKAKTRNYHGKWRMASLPFCPYSRISITWMNPPGWNDKTTRGTNAQAQLNLFLADVPRFRGCDTIQKPELYSPIAFADHFILCRSDGSYSIENYLKSASVRGVATITGSMSICTLSIDKPNTDCWFLVNGIRSGTNRPTHLLAKKIGSSLVYYPLIRNGKSLSISFEQTNIQCTSLDEKIIRLAIEEFISSL